MSGELTAVKQRGRPFQKGQSGNPAGRPRGARNRATVLAEKLMADDLPDVVQAVIKAAKAGDVRAARLVLERIVPLRRGAPVAFDLPKVDSPSATAGALGALIRAVSDGVLTSEEALSVASLLEMNRQALLRAQADDYSMRMLDALKL